MQTSRQVVPTFDRIVELLGVGEVADVLGVTRQRVHQIAHEDETFPTPASVVNRRRFWHRRDIEQWMRSTGRGPIED